MSAFNGSGTFIISGIGLPYVTATVISSTVANQLNQDLAAGLSNCITRDGQSPPTANLPMGGFKFTNMGAATATGQPLIYDQDNARLTKLGIGMAPVNVLDITQNVAANAIAKILNPSNSAAASAQFLAVSDVSSIQMVQLPSTFVTAGNLSGNVGAILAGNRLALNAGAGQFVSLGVNNVEQMRVASNAVFFNNQPRFHAQFAGDTAATAGAYNDLVMGQTLFNVGAGYNTGNGRFIAPVSGTYHFDYVVAMKGTSNGVEMECMLYTAASTFYGTFFSAINGWNPNGCFNGSLQINLNAGDFIGVRMYNGGTGLFAGGGSSNHCYFTGKLVA